MAKVLAVGPVFVDSIYCGLPGFPESGREVYGTEHLTTVGGFAITAIGLRRLGLPSVIISAVGADLFGDYVEHRLRSERVDTHGLVRVANAATSHSTAMVLKGDRRFVSYAGAELIESELWAEWTKRSRDPFKDVSLMHIGLRGDPEMVRILRDARRRGVLVSMTCGWPSVVQYQGREDELAEVLSQIDLLFCNEIEARGLSGTQATEDALQFFTQYGCRPVITLGEKGAVTLDDEGSVLYEDALKTILVDPTGAGDSFAVGFMTATVLGWPLEKALRLGVVCGSLSITALGGTEAFPKDLESVMRYLA